MSDELEEHVVTVLRAETARLADRFDDVKFELIPRSVAESDPDRKQVIPYVVVSSNGRFLSYMRSAATSEERLASALSVGWGGHINSADAEDAVDLPAVVRAGAKRELIEELGLSCPPRVECLGVIDTDSDEVSRFHVGIALLWDFADLRVAIDPRTASQSTWMTLTELLSRREDFELWSAIVIDRLGRISVPGRNINH